MEKAENKGKSGVQRHLATRPSIDMSEHGYSLKLEDVSKSFAGLKAVKSVSLDVAQGERRAIIGPNGAGKTTLFNLIAGNLRLSTGKIFFQGKDITRLACHRRVRKGLARTFQITNLFAELTVIENMVLGVQALQRTKFVFYRHLSSRQDLYEKAVELLSNVGLEDYKNEVVKNLSYGIQRQIEILLALTGNPSLLLLDEPTAGLSPSETSAMVGLVKKMPPSITILIIEHDMDVAFELVDNVTVLHFGGVIMQGTVEEIKKSHSVQEIYLGAESLKKPRWLGKISEKKSAYKTTTNEVK